VFSLTQTLCIGAALLVIVASVPAPRKPGALMVWLVCLGVLGLGALTVHSFVRESGYAPKGRPSERAKYVATQLPKLKAKNVLWLDGGSYPTNAVSHRVLTRELTRLGYDVDVMHLAMGAANHFERQALYRRLTPLFDEHKKKEQRWIYLAEVQRQYDQVPLAQFVDNRETARTYNYITPAIVWDALWALGSDGVRPNERPWRERLELVRHGLVYAFNAGINSRLEAPEKIKHYPGYAPRNTPKKFRFRGLSRVIAAAKQRTTETIPPWVFEIREQTELEIWGDYIARWVYYGVPSTAPSQMNYTRSFCAATERSCIAPTDTKLLEQLDARQYWYNKGHMSARGAQIYSKWLAKKLHAAGVLAR
jgi:hypothetical protein